MNLTNQSLVSFLRNGLHPNQLGKILLELSVATSTPPSSHRDSLEEIASGIPDPTPTLNPHRNSLEKIASGIPDPTPAAHRDSLGKIAPGIPAPVPIVNILPPLRRSSSLIVEYFQGEAAKTNFPFRRRMLKINERLFRCCGSGGVGRLPHSCCTKCKMRTIKCISKTLSGITTVALTILSLGYYGYREYKGYAEDQKLSGAKALTSVAV
ncbi:MAG TPA: hypothetical protein VLE89_00735 [Chlamydiales bacterium]|nr:hypothetical protein [Chlamydiales bacterium]